MYDELTRDDLRQMQEELDHRRGELRRHLLDEVKTARAFGDLSENFEYKAAKQEKNANERRIRYLENMIRTARIVSTSSKGDQIGLFDTVTVWYDEDEEEETFQIVTTAKGDALLGRITNHSPMGKALMGRRVGETVDVPLPDGGSYPLTIRAIQKGSDDGSIQINSF